MFYQMGYLGNISLLSKFKKPNLHPMWNRLFTLLFKSFSECVTGSDSANKLFCPIIYGLYSGINHYYSSILWAQLVQSTLSTSRHLEIYCARFWSFIVKHAIVRLQIQVPYNFVIAAIPIFDTSNFIVSDPTKFYFFGSIPEAILLIVPTDNVLINEYRENLPKVLILCLKICKGI